MSSLIVPCDWQMTTLEICVDILDSQRVPVNNKERQARIQYKSPDQLYPYFGATGEVGKIDGYLFDEELVALGEDGVPFLDPKKPKAYVLSGKTWVNNHAHVLRSSEGATTNQFILHYLNQFDYQGYVNGGTRLKLTQANMRRMPFPLPPLAEQKAIAEKLNTLLAQVESTKARLERIPKTLKRFRQSVLVAAVSGKLTNPKGGREEVEIGGCYLAPENWRSVVLGEVANFVTSGSRGWSKYYSDDGSIFIRSQDINSDELDISEPCFVKLPGKVEGGRTKVQRNDLLITITGANVTKCARIKIDIDDGYVSQHVALVRLKDKRLAAFIEIVLKAINAGRYQLQKSAYGGGKPGLNLQNIKDVELAIPDEVEAERIVRRVDQLFAYANTIETQVNNALERVNNLTQSILAKAFRGELTEQWRKDNPDLISGENSASALLEKIKAERAAVGRKRRSCLPTK